MAFDKNNTSLGMKIVIVIFAVILVVTMCLPFFSGCSSTTSTSTDSSSSSSSSTSSTTTVAGVKAQYQTLIDSNTTKLAADPTSLTYMASLGNAYMDCATAMRSASDASDESSTVEETFQSAVVYYDQYLDAVEGGAEAEASSVSAVTVDRAVCEFYGGKADQAISDLEEFLDGTPDYAMGWLNLGIMYQSQGDTDKAKEAYATCIEKDTDNSGAGTYASLYKSIIESSEEAAAESSDDASASDDSDTGASSSTSGATTAADDEDAAATTASTDAAAASTSTATTTTDAQDEDTTTATSASTSSSASESSSSSSK